MNTELLIQNLLKNAIKDDTILVSIQHANQEIGTLQDIKRIGKICKEMGVIFHTDATHTFTKVPLDVNQITSGPYNHICTHNTRP